jgi:hypothetical protein
MFEEGLIQNCPEKTWYRSINGVDTDLWEKDEKMLKDEEAGFSRDAKRG